METDDPVVVEHCPDRAVSYLKLPVITVLAIFLVGIALGVLCPWRLSKDDTNTILPQRAFEEGAVYGAQAIAQGATNYTQVILSAYRFKAQAKASAATMQQSQIEQARAQYKP